jgi:aspartyl/glutamyl-tRNA(Asn/Gln) amidotransferase C subunit
MTFTEEDLKNLSTLARIDISPEEKEKMLHDMQAILGYISEINAVQGSSGESVHEVYNIVREDVVTHPTGERTEALLNEAPATKEGYVKVEQVLKG